MPPKIVITKSTPIKSTDIPDESDSYSVESVDETENRKLIMKMFRKWKEDAARDDESDIED